MTKSSDALDLPPVRGKILPSAKLSEVTWFRVGGPADALFMPADVDDLADFLKALHRDVPVTVIGVGSNLLIRDGGLDGVVIRLAKGFNAVTVDEGGFIRAGAAALDVVVAKAAQKQALEGLEFFCGIPGSVGGALRMNAGAYGKETKDVLIEAKAVDRKGHIHTLSNEDMGFRYRGSAVPDDFIFVEALFQATPGDASAIQARMDEISESRAATQPIKSRTGGSTFKNPDPAESDGRKAWQLIDAAGCRGLTRGGAQVSELHCNFLLNTGAASAADLEGLGEDVRARVKELCGVALDWEIRRMGRE